MIQLLAVISLLGAGISAFQSYQFYSIRNGTASFRSFCNISENFNCDAVMASSYAEFLAGLPLSSVAAGWFLALFVVALFAKNRFWRRDALRVALLMTLVGSVASVIYFAIMAFRLETFCLFCILVDGLNLAALGIVLSQKPEGLKIHRPDWSKWRTMGVTGAAVFFLFLILLTGLKGTTMPKEFGETAISRTLEVPAVSIPEADVELSIGPKDAPITIVEFSDFQCPYCRMGAQTLHAVMNRYPRKVRVVLRNFPLDPSCNRNIQRSMHPAACESARAVVCAAKQNKFKPVYETIFDHQERLAAGVPMKLTKEVPGIDHPSLEACMNSPETAAAVAKDIEHGIQLNVAATPTFFINGRRVQGPLPLEAWSQLVDRLLQ